MQLITVYSAYFQAPAGLVSVSCRCPAGLLARERSHVYNTMVVDRNGFISSGDSILDKGFDTFMRKSS